MIDEEDLLNINTNEKAEFKKVLHRDKIPQGSDTQVAESDQSKFFSKKIANSELFSGKLFLTWEECDLFLNQYGSYNSKSKKDTVMKKTKCQFLINALCPKFNNPDSKVQINKVVNEHNHRLNVEMIAFEENKKFSAEMIKDINC
ncbi:hypothetical protein C2G38_2173343 [Gigaspora rosea]|uniref:FAR1 domain-containing protein n=1 Tax=Gigaspora rosea TaxID=44941 RepID=A0A397VJN3_9GLOM|nr:hypothetical protein C2G38_2173343 [Gigaspora rosea]